MPSSAPTSSNVPNKVGQFWVHTISDNTLDVYIATKTSPANWIKIFSIAPTMHTQTFTSSGTFTVPESVGQNFMVTLVGGGAIGGNSGTAAAVLKKQTLTLTKGASIPVTIGAKYTSGSHNGNTSSFGSLLSASGGVYSTTYAGASAIADGGMGGGGAYGSSSSSASPNYGGNGGTYGGGGGGAYARSQGNGHGGNGGTYGGGGGGGGSYSSWASAGGSGGTYGGNGGTGGIRGGTYASDGQDGTNTTGMDLDFTGTGTKGSGALGSSVSQTGGGGGGGGYGGNGGNGSVPGGSSSDTGAGGGGGGYGGNGANASSYYAAGGGGGYGGNADQYHGGGYGPDNYGSYMKSGFCSVSWQSIDVVFSGTLQ